MSKLVYVLDDDPVAAELCATILQSLEWQAEIYQDVESLIANVKARPPDAIFLDETTPGADGFLLSARLRGDLGLPGVKLVVMETRSNGRNGASQAVADARLEKPFRHEQIFALLSRLQHDKL